MSTFTNHQVDPNDITQIVELKYENVSKHAFNASLLTTFIFFAVILIGAIVSWFFIERDFFIVLIIFGIITFFTLLMVLHSYYYFKMLKYSIREKDLTLKEGVIFLSTTTLPFNRVQHAEINQSFTQRFFKIATLNLFTSGGTGVDMSIHSLDERRAEEIKAFILQKSAKEETIGLNDE
jgi:uncharacterized protein